MRSLFFPTMFFDLLSYLSASCPPHVRHMDYLSEAIAMRGRYVSNSAAWKPHHDNSRHVVLSAAEQCRNRSKAVVLGAGLLLDVPLAELSSQFREVVLVDIVFLPEVRRRITSCCNVRLLQYDVTGMARALYDAIRLGSRHLPEAAPLVPELNEAAGLVVSLNILSQLWVIPRAYALKKLPGLDPELIDDWCRQIVKSHYDYLVSLPCDVCLVADHEFVMRDREERIVSRDSTIAGLSLPAPDVSWTWDIMPKGDERHCSKELIVGAWHVR